MALLRFRASLAELIKNFSDRSMQFLLVLSGVASNVTDLVKRVPSIRRNIVGIPVLNMTDDEIRELLSIGDQHGDVRFAEDAKTLLIAQHACLAAAAEEKRNDVSMRDVNAAIARAAEEIGSRHSPSTAFALSKTANRVPSALIARAAAEAVRHGGIVSDAGLIAEVSRLDGSEPALSNRFRSIPRAHWRCARMARHPLPG